MLTTTDAARELGISERRVQQLVKDGVLPAERLGKTIVIQERHLAKARKRPGLGRPKGSKNKAKAGTAAGTDAAGPA